MKQKIYTILLILSGAGMMLFGLYRQETEMVLEKAIRICLECIGIG